MDDSKTIKLSSGYQIPVLGLGTWQSPPGEVKDAVEFAVTKAHYRHIDCASVYANEPEVGAAFTTLFKNGFTREELFITSKLWNTNHKAEHVEEACLKTLADLKLDYLDLYLMHWGVPFKHGKTAHPIGEDKKALLEPVSIQETWRAMEALVKKGLVKSIGVANFTTMMLFDLGSYASIQPAVNQIELHPYNSQAELLHFCEEKNIAVTAYSPLGRPGAIENPSLKLVDNPEIVKIAKSHEKSAAQILLRWAIQRGTIIIPKSVNPNRIMENKNVFDFELSQTEMISIDGLNKNYRFVDPSNFWGIPYFK